MERLRIALTWILAGVAVVAVLAGYSLRASSDEDSPRISRNVFGTGQGAAGRGTTRSPADLRPLATPSSAQATCARALIDDWYGDGYVDGSYDETCYSSALTLARNRADVVSAIRRAFAAQ